MNIWTTVLLVWVGVNLVLVGLMWRYQWMKERTAARRRLGNLAPGADPGSSPSAGGHLEGMLASRGSRGSPHGTRPPTPRRIVSFTSAQESTPSRAATTTVAAATQPACTAKPFMPCQLHEMHDEIRVLKLTVAELALDKAMLSAAAARKKALP